MIDIKVVENHKGETRVFIVKENGGKRYELRVKTNTDNGAWWPVSDDSELTGYFTFYDRVSTTVDYTQRSEWL